MILKAATVWAGPGRLLHDAGVRIAGKKITEIAPFNRLDTSRERVTDLGDAILLPALINAHTHLDLSGLKGKTEKGGSFGRWLMSVAKARSVALFEGRSVRRGIGEVVRGGSAAVGDISVSGKSAALLARHGLNASIVFCEALGLRPQDATARADQLRAVIEGISRKTPLRLGISPHAPYSVSPQLFEKCIGLAEELRLPLAIHAAESEAEVQFLTQGTGELRDLMERYGLLPSGWTAPGKRPIHYLDALGVLERRPLLIHCYQVDASEADLVAKHGCSVAYCPRSNAFFRRPVDTLYLLRDAGVNVALGTDSLASNDSLSMLDEMRFVHHRHPGLGWEAIVEMATVNVARALGIEHGGELAVGGPANITAVRPAPADDPGERILGSGSSVIFTMHKGRKLRKLMRK